MACMSPDVSDVPSLNVSLNSRGYTGLEMRASKAPPIVLSERSSSYKFGQTPKASRSLEQPSGVILQCYQVQFLQSSVHTPGFD